jgi:uncharacterized protein YjeT (DUF2065 family)
LIVEGEPRNVNLAGTFENSRREITATTVAPNHHIRLIGAVEFLIGTAIMKYELLTSNLKFHNRITPSFFAHSPSELSRI